MFFSFVFKINSFVLAINNYRDIYTTMNGKILVMVSFKFGDYTLKHIEHFLVSRLEMMTFPEILNFYCLITLFILSFTDPWIKAFCLFKKGSWAKTRQYLVWHTWSVATSLQRLTCPSFMWTSKDVSWTHPSTFFRYLYLFE